MTRLCLGTANFGLVYGISNRRQLTQKESFSILDHAYRMGIRDIDTAAGYGTAETVLGTYFAARNYRFRVCTKLPKDIDVQAESIVQYVDALCQKLSVENLHILMVHDYQLFDQYKEIFIQSFERLKHNGKIQQWGVSLYHPEEALHLYREGLRDIALQIPLNLFDQRFAVLLQKALPFTFLVRSTYLQGLFFREPEQLPLQLQRVATQPLHILHTFCQKHGISVEALARFYIASLPQIDYVVVGVDHPRHLTAFDLLDTPEYIDFSQFAQQEPSLILPYLWDNN